MTSPADEYRRRLSARREAEVAAAARLDRVGQWRVGVLLGGVIAAVVGAAAEAYSPWWGLLAAGPIAAQFVLGVRLAARRRWYGRLAGYYELGLRRVAGDWAGTGVAGERFLDPDHLAAADLDLFGRGSLYERVCTARTADGQARLAGWFLAPAPVEVVRARQLAVAELRGRLDLRESLAAAGADAALDASPLIHWAEATRAAPAVWRVRTAFGLGWVNVATCAGWLIAGLPAGVLLLTLAGSAAVVAPLRRWVSGCVAAVEDTAANLTLLSAILARFEREPFADPLLAGTQERLRADGTSASEQIAALARLAEWLAARRNPMFLPVRLLMLWDVRMAAGVDAWRRRSGARVRVWLDAVAELEALSGLAAYAYENPGDPFPDVRDGPPLFAATGLAHPLMPAGKAVRNDVRLGDGSPALVVSGSNMSGKSTLLRAVGVNAVLALAGGPVRVVSLTLSPLTLAATLRVQDSLSDGRSRFFAEVLRVRAAIGAARSGPVLFLFDELFAGTNSADRVRGAAGVVRALLDAGAVGLVTTHDLAVTELPADVRDRVANVHFADQWVDGEMRFDHVMRPGVVPHTNGAALMRAVGLDV